MKIRSLLCTLTLALALPLGLNAQPPGGGKQPETELGKKMEAISGAFRTLRRQATDATKNADSLAKVAIIKEAATAALKLEPDYKSKKPASEQAKFVADYQADMKAFLGLVEKLEAAFKANDNAGAEKLLATMNDAQKQSHTSFKAPKQKKG
jgi:hypothetical protein